MEKPFEISRPFEIFADWYGAAGKQPEPTAMTLSTVDKSGRPASRVVLLKSWDERGFVFYTNAQSRKGNHLAKNPQAALNFFWPNLNRQIRIEGMTEKVEGKEADDYFKSREAGKKVGAWASKQSEVMPSREALLKRIQEYLEKFSDDIPRPPYWHGYRLKPDYFEFWQEGEFRLHDRTVFEMTKKDGWKSYKLYP